MKSNLFSNFYVLILVVMVYGFPTTAITSELRPCPSVGGSVCTQTMEGDSFSITHNFGNSVLANIVNENSSKHDIKNDNNHLILKYKLLEPVRDLSINLLSQPITIQKSQPFNILDIFPK